LDSIICIDERSTDSPQIGYRHRNVVCPYVYRSVCLSVNVCASVTKCIVAKRYILQQKIYEQVNRKCP